MRRLLPLLLLALCAVSGVMAAESAAVGKRLPPGIVGQDDRTPLDSTAWPWHSLGRLSINREKGEYCSGALIAPDAVLTAGHCLYNRILKNWQSPEAIIFVAGLNRDTYQASSHGKAIVHDPDFHVQGEPNLTQIAHDWAVLRLQEPLPLKPLPVRRLPASDPKAAHAASAKSEAPHLLRAGYSMDRPFLLSLHDGCNLLGRLENDAILFTNCDSTYGDSGSPLLMQEGGQFWIVGVGSAILKRGRNPGAYAVHSAVFINQLHLR